MSGVPEGRAACRMKLERCPRKWSSAFFRLLRMCSDCSDFVLRGFPNASMDVLLLICRTMSQWQLT